MTDLSKRAPALVEHRKDERREERETRYRKGPNKKKKKKRRELKIRSESLGKETYVQSSEYPE